MAGFRHISTRLIFWILGGASLALFAVGYYQQRETRSIVLAQARARTAAVAVSVREELQGILRSVETTVQLSAANLEATGFTSPGEVEEFIRRILNSNRRIYGSAVAFEPRAGPGAVERFAPYLHRQDDKLVYDDLAAPSYGYWNQEWYRRPLGADGPVWTEPYFDRGAGDILMVTCALPFHRPAPGGRRAAGVVTADIALGWLKRMTESNQTSRNGFVIIFTGSGQIVAHPDTRLILTETLTSLATKYGRPQFAEIYREVAAGRSGSVAYDSLALRARAHAEYQPVGVGGWGVIVGFEEEEFLVPVRAAGRVAIWSGGGALLLLAGLIVFVSRRITRPLAALAVTAAEVARGNLEAGIAPPRSQDEVGRLTAAFDRMRADLRQYIADLATTTAAKQKLESELAIARQIQRTMLPAPRHTMPGRRTAEISAQIQPAKAVGGDLYTYFPTGPARLCFAVGDVSDKGVPAALFMARTITLLKTIGRETSTPDGVLRRVNAELCPDNDECMFVTLFCGFLDLDSGELVCASAGHEPPVVLSATGGVRLWAMPAGPALGLDLDINLPVSRLTLEPGDTLLLHTDGVTDAANPAGELYTRERLLRAAGRADPGNPDFTAGLLRQVQAFAAGAPPADDITLFVGSPGTELEFAL